MTFPPERVNANMKKLLPETRGCSYADYPMNHGSKWLRGNEKTPKGEPCFIRTENKLPEEGAKTGYVWGAGQFGHGHYHLLTREAHVTLYQRIHNNKVYVGPSEGFCCWKQVDPRSQLRSSLKESEKTELRLIFHARSVSTAPNDGQARKDQIEGAQNMAQAELMYNGDGPDLVEAGRLANKYTKHQQSIKNKKMNRS